MESAIPMCWNSSWRFANKGGYGQKNISGIKEIVIRANGLTVSGMHGNAVCISLKRKNLKCLGKNDVVRFDSKVGSGFGKNIANWVRRSMAYPTNVLHLATECGNRK